MLRDRIGGASRPEELCGFNTRFGGLVGGVRIGQGLSMQDDLRSAGITLAPSDDGEPLRLAELRVVGKTGAGLPPLWEKPAHPESVTVLQNVVHCCYG